MVESLRNQALDAETQEATASASVGDEEPALDPSRYSRSPALAPSWAANPVRNAVFRNGQTQ
jgi:hypothetical protein